MFGTNFFVGKTVRRQGHSLEIIQNKHVNKKNGAQDGKRRVCKGRRWREGQQPFNNKKACVPPNFCKRANLKQQALCGRFVRSCGGSLYSMYSGLFTHKLHYEAFWSFSRVGCHSPPFFISMNLRRALTAGPAAKREYMSRCLLSETHRMEGKRRLGGEIEGRGEW